MTSDMLPPSISYTKLVESIGASGLVTGDTWELAQRETRDDSGALVELLLARDLLTRFQLAALAEGRGEALRVGNYDLLDRLGAGGMGTVFKARHRRMKRVVALKVLSANLSKNPLFVKRFQREVETIACLGHPNVVMAYDADEAEVGHFLVMEFVAGPDLASYVHKYGPMSPPLAVDCLLQAARGLAYAHSQEIIHRDVKPHNLLRDENGTVKVTDLGLARLSHDAEDAPADGGVTMAGGVIGTPEYMSPEQAVDSTTLDPRTDIYSLGCTLHYLLTGRPPYRGANIMAILLLHRDGPIPSLQAERPETPAALDKLFRRMMAKYPDDRIAKMSEVVSDLEAIAASFPSPSTVPTQEIGAGATVELSAMSAAPAADDLGFDEQDVGDIKGGEPRVGPPATKGLASTAQLADATVAIDARPTATAALTVLVVEPSRVQASIIKGYLQEHGLNVVGTASVGQEAFEAVRSLRPRVVVSSMFLSDVSGLELARKIRREIPLDSPAFVLVTTEGNEAESAALAEIGRAALLIKPFSADQLAESLKRVAIETSSASGSAPASATATNVPARQVDRSRLRVLIVDDSGVARLNARNVLQACGFVAFVEVPDGAHAIAVASRDRFDLIVTDYNMPLMDGRALVSYLKQSPYSATIPILMVTTETDASRLEAVRRLGVVAILEKAFPIDVVGPLLDVLFP